MNARPHLAILQGDAATGIGTLRDHATRVYSARGLRRGLAATGQLSDSFAVIEETIQNVETNGDYYCLPEALRVKAGLLLSMSKANSVEAHSCFMQSLELSRRQGARAWELCAAADLARLRAAEGRVGDARALLQSRAAR
jgi:predicted ATPase